MRSTSDGEDAEGEGDGDQIHGLIVDRRLKARIEKRDQFIQIL